MKGMLRRAVAAAAVAAASILLFAGGTLAWASPDAAVAADVVAAGLDDFVFESMDVEYTLGRAEDGTSTLEVVETFVAVFPEFDQNRGMRRLIPESYEGAPLHPEFVSITDGAGNPRPAEVESEDDVFSMTSRADDFVHGAQTYVFTYRLQNVTRFFADTGADEFYWNVNGIEWAQPFGRVTATLHVAPALADAMTGAMACYRGYAGETDRCDIGVQGDAVVAAASELAPYQTMTIAVAFADGTFTPFDPAYLSSPWGWLQGLAAVGMVGGVVGAGVVRARRLRDEPGRPTIIAEYTPPPEIDALESAVLLGRTTKAIPAEVLEQAVVGSIRIVEGERKWFGGVRLTAELIDPSLADGDGRLLLHGLFPAGVPGEVYEFGRKDTRLSAAAQRILKLAESQLARRGLRRRVSGWTRAWPVLLVSAMVALVMVFGFIALDNLVAPVIPLLVMVAAAGAEIIVIALVARKPLTAKGAETRDHLKGLKEFIEWAEADRIRMLQSPQGAERVPIDTTDPRVMLKLYETLLPYAVVFGQERQWAAQLAVLYASGTPTWYVGTHGFDAGSFSSGISSLSASTAASSSTSGGSSGGGSAGGGGGGGGGGGV
jgi:uncharacterized membrane protein YgcG